MSAGKNALKTALHHLALLAAAAIMLAPLVWMVSTSLKPPHEIMSADLHLLPIDGSAAANYRKALGSVPLLRFLFNGFVVCGAILALQLLVAVPCAYAMAKMKWPGRGGFLAVVLLCLMVPQQAPAIPIYIALYELGLMDTYTALIAPFAFSAFGIFLLRQYFMTIPDDLIYAGRMDGMGEAEIMWRIVAPAAAPALVAFSIFSVIVHWNDLFWPLVVVATPELATPPRGVLFFKNDQFGSDYGAMMAMAVLITLPLILMIVLLQRRFVDGIIMTRRKG